MDPLDLLNVDFQIFKFLDSEVSDSKVSDPQPLDFHGVREDSWSSISPTRARLAGWRSSSAGPFGPGGATATYLAAQLSKSVRLRPDKRYGAAYL